MTETLIVLLSLAYLSRRASFSMTLGSLPMTLTPTGVRMPVASMSMRALIGMVHAFEPPGKSYAGCGIHLDLGIHLVPVLANKGYIDNTTCGDGSADVVISNGVINLATDKGAVFREAARLLKPGGRLAISDIVTASELPDTMVCNTDLWAACIGGAMRHDSCRWAIEGAGFQVESVRDNAGYRFISLTRRALRRSGA